MLTRIGALLVTASIALATFGPVVAQQGHNPSPVASPVSAGAWTVTDTREIVVDGGIVTLSPDGQWIAGTGVSSEEVCVWEVATLEPTCATADVFIHQKSMAWAPDSSAVAWSSEPGVMATESDIHIFDIASGTVINLTDDGFSGSYMSQGDAVVPVDTMPAWAPDSQSLTFARTAWSLEAATTDIMSIARSGGEPELRSTAAEDYDTPPGYATLGIDSTMHSLSDGSLLYALTLRNGTDPRNGIWLLPPEGEARQVLSGTIDQPYPQPTITAVRESPAGVTVSGYSPVRFEQVGTDASTAFLLDVATGTVTATEHPDGSHLAVSPVSFAPRGIATIGLEWQDDTPHLVIEDGSARSDLGSVDAFEQAFRWGIDWAENDTILTVKAGSSFERGGVLLAVAPQAQSIASTSAQQGHSPSPAASPVSTSTWVLAETRPIDVDGLPVALSPDGQWIAGIGPEGNELCVWDVASLEPACDGGEPPIHAASIAWAPDSAAVAYSVDAAILLRESDIYVFDVASGTVTNLTDDGIEGGAMSQVDEVIPVDIMPAWAPDSQSLTFVRSVHLGASGTTDLMTIGRSGGEPEPLTTIADDMAFAISSPMRILADGSLLYAAWLIAGPDSDDDITSIWLLDPAGETRQVMPGIDGAPFPGPVITDVRESSEGTLVSGYSTELFAIAGIAGSAFLLDVATGTAAAVEHPDGLADAASPPSFAPDGTSTIGLEWQGDVAHLVIRNGAGAADLGAFDAVAQAFDRGIEWSATNTILVVDVDGNGTVLTVTQTG